MTRVLDLATTRYEGGVATYLDVITAQQALLNAERLASQLQGQRLLVAVFLVKALGGDWRRGDSGALMHPERQGRARGAHARDGGCGGSSCWSKTTIPPPTRSRSRPVADRLLHRRVCDRDIRILLYLVDRKKIEAGDWSLTPGRYVGVAPPEKDEDFDFEQTLRDIHTELVDLNKEAVELASKIQENFEELGI